MRTSKPKGVRLECEHGLSAYVDVSAIVIVTAPFVIKDHPESRTVGMVGGHKVYVLNTADNAKALAPFIPKGAPALESEHYPDPPEPIRRPLTTDVEPPGVRSRTYAREKAQMPELVRPVPAEGQEHQ